MSTQPKPRRQNLVGRVFGRLTVRLFAWTDEACKSCWVCRCECGKGIVTRGGDLIQGRVVSCGCYRSEKTSERQRLDLIGKRFGRLIVVAPAGQSRRHANYRWTCRCDCGQTAVVPGGRLTSGNTRSCGCTQVRHGRATTPEYRTWIGMRNRCTNPKDRNYPRYGGRGIGVCAEWAASFAAFFAHVGPRPSASHTLDRFPNRNGGYEPGNVRWATKVEQAANRCTTLEITCDGRIMSAEEWGRETGIPADTIRARLARNWPDDVAVKTPVRRRAQMAG